MASVGQKVWNDDRPEVVDNNYPVKAVIRRGLYYTAAANTLFCKLNGPRELKTIENIHKGGTHDIPDGATSPVWMQDCNENNRVVFTMREPNKGMPTYGDAPVKTAQFAEYMHCDCNVRLVSSPAWPVVAYESQQNVKRVINDVVQVEKANITRWVSEEMDFDAFRAIFMGASRGLLAREDGGMGIVQSGVGGVAGQHRAPINTFVAGNNDLTTRAFDLTTHNRNLGASLATLYSSNAPGLTFTYDTHLRISYLVDQLGLQPVKIGGEPFRAVAITDDWNTHILRDKAGPLAGPNGLWANATERSDKNLAIYSRNALVLDNILYIPTTTLRHFRPTVDTSNDITWGAGMDIDPRSGAFNNTSPITTTVVLGAGALLRGHRVGELGFTEKVGDHGKGQEYAFHYNDGWRRADWFAQDGRQKMINDSMLVVFNRGVNPMAL